MAASLPITWAQAWIEGFGHHRIDLAGHDRAPRLDRRQQQFAETAARAAAEQADIVGDLVQGHGAAFQGAARHHHGILGRLRLEMVGRFDEGQPGGFGQAGNDPPGELGMGIDAGADGGAAQGQFVQSRQGLLQTAAGQFQLAGVAGKNLAEANRRGVLQVGAADLDDVVEGGGLFREPPAQLGKGRQQALPDLHGGGQMQGGGDDVVARLAEVDVVVGMNRPAAFDLPKQLDGPVGDDLVGVHVGARPRAGLKDVEDEVPVEFAGDDFLGRFHDRHGPFPVQQPQLQVDPGGALLDHPQGTQKGAGKAQAGDGKVFQGAGGLGAVQGRRGDGHGAHGIEFLTGCGHRELLGR
jgi:hypothetical protein